LLYADHIELVSLRTVIIGSMLQVGIASEPDVIDIMVGLDDNMLRYMNGGEDVDPTFRSTLSKVAAYMRLPGGLNRHMDRAAEMMRETLAPTMEQFRSNALNMFEDSELAELVPAFQSGIVELSRSGITDDVDNDQSMENWAEIIKTRLGDPTKRVLLDDRLGDLVTAMIDEGHVRLPELGPQHLGEASIGPGRIARLPAVPQAPTDELLDLRTDMQSPLVRYRAEVAKMAREISNPSAFGIERQADIDQLWLERVDPALSDLRDGFAEHSLVKELARSTGRDMRTVITMGTGGSVFVGLELVTSLNAWVAAAAGAGPVVAGIFGNAAVSRGEARRTLERHELFFLYEVDRRLGSESN